MSKLISYKQVIDLWPKRQALADTLAKVTGEQVFVGTVNYWLTARKITRTHWPAMVAAAKADGIEGVTHESLAELEKYLYLEALKNG